MTPSLPRLACRFAAILGAAFACTDPARAVDPIAYAHVQWTAARQVNPGSETKSVRYELTGPGTLVVDYVIAPYRRRDYPSSYEQCLKYDGPDYWTHLRSERWFGGRPESQFKTAPPADGAMADMRSRTVWKIPAGRFVGTFRLERPVNCSLSNCDGFSATASFNAYFYPAGQEPPAPGAMPQNVGPGATPGATPPRPTSPSTAAPASPAGTAPPPTAAPPAAPPLGELRNLALGLRATQSSVYLGTGVDQGPQHGNDGIKTGRDPHDLVHTANEQSPWWSLDLGTAANIDHIRIYNRRNPGVLSNPTLQVLIGDDGRAWRQLYRHNGSRWETLTVPVQSRGRFVRVQLAEPGALQFYEVEVWGRN